MINTTEETPQGKIEFSIYGNGDPVLFIHGGHSNSREISLHKLLNPGLFKFITPSRPGYGQTPLAQNTTPEKAARQILALMDQLNYQQFNVIGVSAGGLTAIAIASLYPERVKKLILISAISKRWLYPKDDLYKKGRKLFHPKLEKWTWGMLKFFLKVLPGVVARKMLAELSKKPPTVISKHELESLKSMLIRQRSKKGFITDLEHYLKDTLIENINIPTLIVHSKNDKAVSTVHPTYAKAKIVNAQLLMIDNPWGHMVWIGQSSKSTIKHIVNFLKAPDH